MSNFKNDLIEALKQNNDLESVEAVRVDTEPYSYYRKNPPSGLIGKIIDLQSALALFDYEYDSGYGGQECHDFTLWTKNRIYYVHEYDGSTCIVSVDRNPIEAPE